MHITMRPSPICMLSTYNFCLSWEVDLWVITLAPQNWGLGTNNGPLSYWSLISMERNFLCMCWALICPVPCCVTSDPPILRTIQGTCLHAVVVTPGSLCHYLPLTPLSACIGICLLCSFILSLSDVPKASIQPGASNSSTQVPSPSSDRMFSGL